MANRLNNRVYRLEQGRTLSTSDLTKNANTCIMLWCIDKSDEVTSEMQNKYELYVEKTIDRGLDTLADRIVELGRVDNV
jgi:hypothetical protein